MSKSPYPSRRARDVSHYDLHARGALTPHTRASHTRAGPNILYALDPKFYVRARTHAHSSTHARTHARARAHTHTPQVSHVYNLGLIGTPADYLHRAGRCGRIGQVNKCYWGTSIHMSFDIRFGRIGQVWGGRGGGGIQNRRCGEGLCRRGAR